MEFKDCSSINDSVDFGFFQSQEKEEEFDPSIDIDLNYIYSEPIINQSEDINSKCILNNNIKAINSNISAIKNTIDESKETLGSSIQKKKFEIPVFIITKDTEAQTDEDLLISNYNVSIIGSRIILSLKNSI